MDVTLVLSFLLLIIAGGMVAALSGKLPSNPKEYLINNASTPLWQMVGTTVATAVGGGIVMGIVESTYVSGPGYGIVVWATGTTGMLLMMLLAPRIRALVKGKAVYNLPDLMGAFHGRRIEMLTATVLLLGMVGILAGQVMALKTMAQVIGGASEPLAVGLGIGGVILYALLAGIRGDIRADQIYFVTMLLGMVVVGGSLWMMHAPGDVLTLPPEILSPLTFGGWSFLIAGVLLGGLTTLVSMEYWLRIWAADSVDSARRSLGISILIITPFVLISVLLGWSARYYFPSGAVPGPEVYPRIVDLLHSPVLAAFLIANLSAVVLSTANTMILMIATTLGRNIFQFKESNLFRLRSCLLLAGLLAAGLAWAGESITGMLLGSYYILFGLVPPLVALVAGQPLSPAMVAAMLVLSALTALVSIPLLGTMAFAPTLVVTFGLWALFSLKLRFSK